MSNNSFPKTLNNLFKIRTWKFLFVENHNKDKPVPLNLTYYYRKGIVLLLIFFAFSIFYTWWQQDCTTILKGITVESDCFIPYWYDLKPYIVFFMTIIYVWYFYIVYKELILNYPPEKIFWQQTLYPTVLGLAYFLYFLDSFFDYKTIKTVYLSIFLLHYFLWLLRDYFERRDKTSKRLEKSTWFLIEGLACIIFLLAIFSTWDLFHQENPTHFTSFLDKLSHLMQNFGKEIAVLLSIIVYYLIKHFIIKINKDTKYRELYSDYLNSLVVESKPKVKDLLENQKIIKVLDFGCGDGTRLNQFFEMSELTPDKLSIVGYDILREWRKDFIEQFTSSTFTNDYSDIENKQFDLIHISHVLYTSKTFSELKKYIKNQSEDCIIVFRGNAPSSIFVGISCIKATKFAGLHKSHIWYNYWLANLIKKCNLKRLDESKNVSTQNLIKANQDSFNPPDSLIEQKFRLKKNSVEHLVNFLEYLHDEDFDYTLYAYLHEAVKYNESELLIPSNDMMYLYKVEK